MSFNNILPGNQTGSNADGFDIFAVEAAGELGPVPPGRYVAIAERGGPKTAKTGTPGYEIQFRILEGELAGRKAWKFFARTPKAAAITRRDLEKFGITSREQLERDLPAERFVVELFVTLRTDPATGNQANDVKSIKVIRVEPPKSDPFAPTGNGAVLPETPGAGGSEGADSLCGPQGDSLGGLRR